VFIDAGKTCKHVWNDVQSLSQIACDCAGFAPVTGSFAEASFADTDGDDFQLRVARPR
jgi:hypothetical protein